LFEVGILKLGGVQKFDRELDRISKKYSRLFKRNNGQSSNGLGTIFQYLRRQQETKEQDKKTAKQGVVNFVIFFNQCKMCVSYEDIDKMDTDILLMTYESLIEQKYQELLEYDKIQK
jgi:hypothetical protein